MTENIKKVYFDVVGACYNNLNSRVELSVRPVSGQGEAPQTDEVLQTCKNISTLNFEGYSVSIERGNKIIAYIPIKEGHKFKDIERPVKIDKIDLDGIVLASYGSV